MIWAGWIRVIAYNVLMLLVVLPYAFWRGGLPERIAAATLAAGSLMTFGALQAWPTRGGQPSLPVLVIDLTAAAVLVTLAVAANRRWTIWLAAAHLSAIVAHAVTWNDPGIFRWVYHVSMNAPGWMMLVLIAVGTWRHHDRVRRYGVDASWRISSGRSPRIRRTPAPPR